MSAALSPEPEEPEGSRLPGDQGADGAGNRHDGDGDGRDGDGDGRDGPDEPDDDVDDGWVTDQGLQHGLYVTAAAGDLSLEGFAQDGRTDTMAPGPLLAMILDTIAGPDGKGLSTLADDQLIGFLSGTRRMAARLEWARMAALAEFASRPRRDEFAADEVAAAFRLDWMSAAGEIIYSQHVAKRLPVTFAGLAAGKLDATHVQIIADRTSILSDEDAAIADQQLAELAQSKTYAELRRAATKLVNKLDPEAARKSKEKARRETQVRAFREASGNAGITAREMPSVEVLASMQHVENRACALRDAGVPGTWEELKTRALLDLLQERDSRPAAGDVVAESDGSPAAGAPGPDASDSSPDGSDPGDPRPDGSGPGGSGGPGPGSSGPSGPGSSGPGHGGPSLGALITITVPHTALGGDSGAGSEVDGFGILDDADTRDLIAAAARNPATRWCLTTLNPDGTAATHDCAAGPRPWGPAQGPPGHQPGHATLKGLLDLLYLTSLTPVIRGPCDHTSAENHYRPSKKLQHRVKARNTTCTAPGCGRRAARCDLDHTDPHDQGGLTCECNLAPLCRHHHRCKQAEGWRLEQPEPGVLRWRTPSGRTYTTTPTQYAA